MSHSEPTSGNTSLADQISRLSAWKLLVALLLIALVLLSLVAVQRARAVQSEYRAAVEQVAGIHEVAHREDIYALSAEDMSWLQAEFALLEERIDEIDRLGELPLGFERQLGGLPWIEPRYRAGTDTLELGRTLAQSGGTIAGIGGEAISALDGAGVRHDPASDADTWLDVIVEREDDLDRSLDQIDQAMQVRDGINEQFLPQRIVERLNQIDEVMEQFSDQLELADDLPLAYEALGAGEPRRYLVLFQNPAELRPTGGFVGTIAELELHRGQISHYEFQDVYHLSDDYGEQTEHRVRAPWAIREYIRSDHLQFQDANWSADFPVSAELLIEMAEAAGWSELDGVVSVQPETIEDLISVIGSITVEVDGDQREITSGNLHDEAERQRRIIREGGEAETDHKEVIELISENLVDELSSGDQQDLIDSVFLLFDRFDNRDMQVFHQDDDVQAFLEDLNWAGLRKPEPGTPTLFAVFANITGLKTSLVMQPDIHLEILESDSAGVTEAILTIGLGHLGAEEGDPFYEGFQRWWLDVLLPSGSAVVGTVPDTSADPDASNGGSYVVNLPVGEREGISVRFSMPETDRLLIRRQPGLVTLEGAIDIESCNESVEFRGEQDVVLLLDRACPVVEHDEPDRLR